MFVTFLITASGPVLFRMPPHHWICPTFALRRPFSRAATQEVKVGILMTVPSHVTMTTK